MKLEKQKCFHFFRVTLSPNDLPGLVTQLQEIFIDFCIYLEEHRAERWLG